MDRQQVLDVVLKHIALNIDLEGQTIDPSLSMATYGASSLDIVEVVAGAMRELGLRVPRAEMAGLTNINGLVDLLWQHKQQA